MVPRAGICSCLGTPVTHVRCKSACQHNSTCHVPSECEAAYDVCRVCSWRFLLCAAAEAHLLTAARRQLDLSRGLPDETRRRRLVMWLQRRGHSWDTISKLLQQTELAP